MSAPVAVVPPALREDVRRARGKMQRLRARTAEAEAKAENEIEREVDG